MNEVLDAATKEVDSWPEWMRRPEIRGAMEHKFRTAEDYRDHLPCNDCEPKSIDDPERYRRYRAAAPKPDAVNHPPHYQSGGLEVIDVIEAFGLDKDFNLGNVLKYILRAGRKDPAKMKEDLEKALWYLQRRISRLP